MGQIEQAKAAFKEYTAKAVEKWAREDAAKRERFRLERDKRLAGCVYFIACDENNRVKIGISKDLKQRLNGLRSSNSIATLYVFGYIGTTSMLVARRVEAQLHQEFKEYHSHYEWFHFNDKTKKMIDLIINQSNDLITLDTIPQRFLLLSE